MTAASLLRRSPWLTAAAFALGLAPWGQVVAQTLVWSEDFENSCASLCLARDYVGPAGAWVVEDVTPPGSSANTWYVSCAENGNAEGECGGTCAGSSSLHVGNVSTSPAAFLFCPPGDCGAAYDTSGATVVSDKRAMSPLIDLSGRSALTLSLVFIAGGEPCEDAADLEYSPDGGMNWELLSSCLQSSNAGCSGQGRWTALSVDLPQSAEDNPNVRVALRWRNDGDFMGSDPSFAVDGIRIETDDSDPCDPPTPLDVNLYDELRVGKLSGDVGLDWTLIGPTPGPATHWHVYRWTDPSVPRPGGWELLGGDAPPLLDLTLSDAVLSDGINYYYDVRAADDCEAIGR